MDVADSVLSLPIFLSSSSVPAVRPSIGLHTVILNLLNVERKVNVSDKVFFAIGDGTAHQ